MAQSGDVITNPITGETIRFVETAKETNGEKLVFDLYLKPNGSSPLEIYHPKQTKLIDVYSGLISVRLGGREHRSRSGIMSVLKGALHSWSNPTTSETHVEVRVFPSSRYEVFLETMFGLARDGKTDERGMPTMLQAAAIADEYEDEVVFGSDLQRHVYALLRPLARLLGYKGRYEEYSGSELYVDPAIDSKKMEK